jgi:hypothetical protein
MASETGQSTNVVIVSPGQQVIFRTPVNFSSEAYDTVLELARSRDTTMSVVLRDAISHIKWFHDLQRNGGKLLIYRPEGVEEVISF